MLVKFAGKYLSFRERTQKEKAAQLNKLEHYSPVNDTLGVAAGSTVGGVIGHRLASNNRTLGAVIGALGGAVTGFGGARLSKAMVRKEIKHGSLPFTDKDVVFEPGLRHVVKNYGKK